MANAAIAFENLADAGDMLASSSIVLAPPATLQSPHVARKWRGKNGDTEYILTSLLEGFDTIWLGGLSLTAAGITRIRVSSVDSAGLAGDVYDSGSAAGRVDPAYAALLVLLPEQVDGYVRIDLQEPGAAYVEAGRLFVGPRYPFPYNFEYGWSARWIDRSQARESRGGQTYIDADVSYRCWSMNFGWVPEQFRNDVLENVDRVIGTRSDMLMIKDTASSRLDRDSLWGRVREVSAIQQPQGFTDSGGLFSKTFEIYERL
jgi:hypothetical protein